MKHLWLLALLCLSPLFAVRDDHPETTYPFRFVGRTVIKPEEHDYEFTCEDVGGMRWRPRCVKVDNQPVNYPSLGWKGGGYSRKEDCDAAVKDSRNGVICTFTGVGYKPTHFSGKTKQRQDYGYFGTSIPTLDECRKASRYTTEKGVCHNNAINGNNEWVMSDVTGKTSLIDTAVFRTLKDCLDRLSPGWDKNP